MMRRFIISLLLSVGIVSAAVAQWVPDRLPGYERLTVDQPDDYSGKVVSTVVRAPAGDCGGDTGILYVHGFNDYFFQKEWADSMVDKCLRFYAVDLRKYGRSLLPGQKPFEVRDMTEYFADIDSALAVMKRDGVDKVVLVGHSTGGLTSSLYMAEHPDTVVKALVLNSPFLDWNLGRIEEFAVPAVAATGKLFPGMPVKQGDSTAYAESLLDSCHGEWNFDTDWKFMRSPDVTAGWIRAIDSAQRRLKSGRHKINVPVLLMHSDKSVGGDRWTPEFQKGDAVLDVADISRYGRRLGDDVTEATVTDGLHDLVLSAPKVRHGVYRTMTDWISRHVD